MKHLTLLFILCLAIYNAQAQRVVEKQATVSANGKVTLNIQIADSIRVITWNKNEVKIKATINVNDNKNNDDYDWAFDNTNGDFEVKAKLKSKPVYRSDCNCTCNYEARVYTEVYVPENANLSVETINGDITITGKTADVRAHTISGFVDFAIAPDAKAYLKMNTISGTMYSNVELGLDDKAKGTKHIGGGTVNSSLNGGGSKRIDLETISGDIYFRKAS